MGLLGGGRWFGFEMMSDSRWEDGFRTILAGRLGMGKALFFGRIVGWVSCRYEIDFVGCLICLSISGRRLLICFR